MKYNDNGEYKDIYVKAFDTLPIGTEVDYIGDTVPTGWTQVDSYSTSEIDTGKTWIDGKPIYRIVYTNAVTSNTTINVATISNLDTLIDCYGTFTTNSGVTINLVYNAGSGEEGGRWWFTTSKQLRYASPDTGTLKIIVEYTKSS